MYERHTVSTSYCKVNAYPCTLFSFSKGFIMKTCLKLCLLSFLVLLLYTTLSVSGNPSPEAALSKRKHPKKPSPPRPSPETLARFKKFINQHVDAKMAANKCDGEVNGRRISKTDSSECKDANTFILATTNHIKPICDKAGKPYSENSTLRISNKPFPVVNCEAKKEGKRVPNSVYNGKAATVCIVISCAQGYPVHYEKGVRCKGMI